MFESMEKIKKDVTDWFFAQEVESQRRLNQSQASLIVNESNQELQSRQWRAPPSGWVKCNIGISWSQKNLLTGSSWVLRDEFGTVILHSRRAFSNTRNKQEGIFISSVWAIESMLSHKVNKVIFALEDLVMVGVMTRPQAWPSFNFQSSELLSLLGYFGDWKVVLEHSLANTGAQLIAQSVTNDCRMQSYVAISFPGWLANVFSDDCLLSSIC